MKLCPTVSFIDQDDERLVDCKIKMKISKASDLIKALYYNHIFTC
jgi:hypothetical protein